MDEMKYMLNDSDAATLRVLNLADERVAHFYARRPRIKNVIFNPPATIVFWVDGTKTVVKCHENDDFDPEKGLAMAIAKKNYGKGYYSNMIRKWAHPAEEVHICKTFDEGFREIQRQIGVVFGSPHRKTYREEMLEKFPTLVSDEYMGGVCGCPRDKVGNIFCNEQKCSGCWDREIPDKLLKGEY